MANVRYLKSTVINPSDSDWRLWLCNSLIISIEAPLILAGSAESDRVLSTAFVLISKRLPFELLFDAFSSCRRPALH